MTKKTIGQNASNSGRISLSGPELEQLDASIGDQVKVDIDESKEIAKATVMNSNHDEFVIVSKSDY